MTRVKELREKKGFTLREFAHFVNDELHYDVSLATLIMLENDKRYNGKEYVDGHDPQYSLVKTLANYFNVSIEYLMGE